MAKAKKRTIAVHSEAESSGSCFKKLVIRPVTDKDWPAIAALFGDKGACGGCWCMYWRVERGGRTWDDIRGDNARAQFHRLVRSGKVHGLLAFEETTPIGWVCVGPYEDFPRLATVRALRRERPAKTWSIVCFYIPPKYRARGLATRLLVAAQKLAKASGAAVVEGYPVATRAGKQLPSAFAWTGVPKMFADAGFAKTAGGQAALRVWLSVVR
ncbi:GNAT family N-acetyltransferase [Bradyrhizobium pachyrhizi]|uniref:GNAT family N-acetyltransferase n=1 Tax=Bradyrhizobium pachyrhizi TaxID=280333 RepID=UPI00067B9860|nr:GNAT family N-acetyltransferase [Bradyrhizobium pachyrhizi]